MKPDRHISTLDGLRGLAALAVVWLHSPLVVGSPSLLAYHGGWYAMDTFFCLSGFLITRILLAANDDGRPMRVFYARRAARIIPPIAVALLVVAWCDPSCVGWWWAATLNVDIPASTGRGVASSLLPLWSIGVEEKFYLLWPVATYALSRERLGRLCLWLIVAPLILAWSPMPENWNPWYYSLPFRLPGFAAGALLALHEGWLVTHWREARKWVVTLIVAGLAIETAGWLPVGVRESARTLPIGVGFVMGALCLHWSGSSFGELLSNRPLRWLGCVSYGTYVYHALVREYAIHHIRASVEVKTVAYIFITLAVAAMSYWLLERPIMGLVARAWRCDFNLNGIKNGWPLHP